ncbi:hypothetical protein T484DRAFT_1773376 [Baffinella frigidus]|nr:hypothetical protein T484DRAFT_1773376 [Cryptophyta sp. CCMP2293]
MDSNSTSYDRSVTELALDDNKITDVGELHVLHNLATLSIEHNKIPLVAAE